MFSLQHVQVLLNAARKGEAWTCGSSELQEK